MKLCFFSDIHGNGYAFDAFLREMEKKKPDKIIFGGDFAGYYYDANRIISKVRELGFSCIQGNHDKLLIELAEGKRNPEELAARYGNSYKRALLEITEENIRFLKEQPFFYEMEADGLRLGFFHGSPRNWQNDRIYPDTEITDETELALFEKYDVVFCGHTHHKLIKQIGTTLLVNGGSAGQQRDGKGTSYALFDTQRKRVEIHSFAYEKEKLLSDIDRIQTENEPMRERLKEVINRKVKKDERTEML